jgi:hypothetical protein
VNQVSLPEETSLTTPSPPSADTRLSGTRLLLARGVWIVLMLLLREDEGLDQIVQEGNLACFALRLRHVSVQLLSMGKPGGPDGLLLPRHATTWYNRVQPKTWSAGKPGRQTALLFVVEHVVCFLDGRFGEHSSACLRR